MAWDYGVLDIVSCWWNRKLGEIYVWSCCCGGVSVFSEREGGLKLTESSILGVNDLHFCHCDRLVGFVIKLRS